MSRSSNKREDKSGSKGHTEPSTSPPTVCIGRDKEFEFLAEQFEKPSSATLIYGDPAIGKSELLRDIEKIQHRPDKGVYVGRWECGGSEDALLYALANLLGKLHEGPLKHQAKVLWSKIKESFSSLESFNDFAGGVLSALRMPGSDLPDFLRSQIELKVDPNRIPLLNREIFLGVVDKCQEIEDLKLILLLDNLSIGFENKPIPPYVQKAFETLRNVLERIGEKSDLHLVVSWKLSSETIEDFQNIRRLFSEYFHEDLKLGPIEDKEGYVAWLQERCASFGNLNQSDKKEVLELTGFLPIIGHEWERQEHHRKGELGKEELEEIARDARERKYGYLSRYLDDPGREELKELVYQLAILPSMHGLTLHQIAELVPMPDNSKICQCGLEGAEQNSFLNWQTKCQSNLEQAMEMAILSTRGKGIEDKTYFFDHESKKDYIRNRALDTPKRDSYLQRAFDFSINHVGYPTNTHPDTTLYVLHSYMLLRQLKGRPPQFVDATHAFTIAFLVNFKDQGLLSNAINSLGFSQLPSHLRTKLLAEAIKFPDKFKLDQVHEDLLATLKQQFTYFQTHSNVSCLTNAAYYYGELGRLSKMTDCLERGEKLYQTHPTPEMAVVYARSLANATFHYAISGKLTEMEQYLKRSEKLYETHPTPEVAVMLAASLYNAIGLYGKSNKPTEMEQYLEWSKKLHETYPTPEVAVEYANSLYNAAVYYGKSGKLAEMEQYLERSEKLHETHPTPEVAVRFANSLYSAIFYHGRSGKLTEMGKYLERSKSLYETYPTRGMTVVYGQSLTQAATFYRTAGDSRTDETVRQLKDLLKDKPVVAEALKLGG